MLKLYSKADGVFRYREAWADEDGITEHWGRVGTEGRTKTHALSDDKAESTQLRRVLQKARAEGFKALRSNQHRFLVVEYKVRGFGSSSDLRKRYKLQDRMDNLLGWRGLGHCDGGSIGDGSMEVCCVVVDFSIAEKVIRRDLRNTPFADYARIYDDGST